MKKLLFLLAIIVCPWSDLCDCAWAISGVYGNMNMGAAFPGENIRAASVWEMRAGYRAKYLDASFGFSNYYSGQVETAPDRLVPGDLGLRTLNAERLFVYPIGKVTMSAGGGFGWTWVSHSPDKINSDVRLEHLHPYEPGAKLTSLTERVHDGFSSTFKIGAEYDVTANLAVGLTLRYFFMHTFRDRDVLIYHENYGLAYNDRYEMYHWTEPVSFDHWALLLTARW